jgi:hypothetical protein
MHPINNVKQHTHRSEDRSAKPKLSISQGTFVASTPSGGAAPSAKPTFVGGRAADIKSTEFSDTTWWS